MTAARLTLGLVLLGLLWRTVRYLLAFPIWGDEALLAINFVVLDLAGLTQRLDNCQIAPLLFLWGERAAYVALGPGELALRLLPFLAATLGLVLFWRWTRHQLGPLACLSAVGFLAVAIWPVSMATLIKPYSFDLLAALLLLVPASCWLARPEQVRWLVLLVLLTPLALLGSNPAVFVAGAVALALLPAAWRGGWASRACYVAFALVMLASFLVAVHIGQNQLATVTSGVDTAAGMNFYWGESFPPPSWWNFPGWFLLLTVGQMTAYPSGGSNGASTLTVLFCIAGVVLLTRRRRYALLTLCLVPILLNLVAAFLHRYPYGASGRLSQHLAPGICLLAGLGLAGCVVWLQRGAYQRGPVRVAVFFALIGLGGLLRDVVYPYRDTGCLWMRDTMADIRRRIPASDPIVICAPPERVECVFTWYWLQEGPRVGWDFALPRVADTSLTVWAFVHGDAAAARTEFEARHPAWRCVERVPYPYRPGTRAAQHYEVFRCVRRSGPPEATARIDDVKAQPAQ